MTELQNIALIYESSVLLVEDAQARKKYLFDKYYGIWPQAVAQLFTSDGRSSLEHNLNAARNWYPNVIDAIVDKLDPTKGKYSEWFLRQMISAAKRDKGRLFNELFNYTRRSEDAYKVAEVLTAFDQFKHKLPVEQRDINTFTLDDLSHLMDPFLAEERELSHKELAKKIKSEDSIKLVDGLGGWTVIIPLTKQAARFYGAGTKWCTNARNDEDNMFDSYTKRGYLYMFMKGNEKFQWWAATDAYSDAKDEYKEWEKAGGHEMTHDEEGYWEEGIGDQSYLTDSEVVQFMDELDHPVRTIKVIPPEVWKATFQAPFTKGDAAKFKDSQASLADWWYETS